MNKPMLQSYSLKFNPFSHNLPTEALYASPDVSSFIWRIEHLSREGGYALVTGPAGSRKSASLRLLIQKFAEIPDVKIGVMSRPQGNVADFYRELGDLFGVPLRPSNRWNSAKILRQRWQDHIEHSLFRSLLIIDEAQEMQPAVFTELRLLASTQLDSHLLLTVVLSGDERLLEKFRHADLIPFASRIRTRLVFTSASPEELRQCLRHVLTEAGNPQLMTDELQQTLCEHATGNYRILMTLANELLVAGFQKNAAFLDEKLYFEVFNHHVPTRPPVKPTGRKRPPH